VNPGVERLNQLLRAELGTDPQFAWKYSETLRRVVLETDNVGQPVVETVRVGNVYASQQRRFIRKLDSKLLNQWVMCMLVKMSEDQGHLEGTGDAAWVIVYDKSGIACAVEPDIPPDDTATWKFIQLLRKSEALSAQREIDVLEDQQKREDEKLVSDSNFAALDAMTAYLETPGVKGSTVFQAGIRDVNLEEKPCQP
jgi:hypothetical protein